MRKIITQEKVSTQENISIKITSVITAEQPVSSCHIPASNKHNAQITHTQFLTIAQHPLLFSTSSAVLVLTRDVRAHLQQTDFQTSNVARRTGRQLAAEFVLGLCDSPIFGKCYS